MSKDIPVAEFRKSVLSFLEETFENVKGIYLDKNTSLVETLSKISAAQASRPMPFGGTTIAAHVDHVRFYIKVLSDYMDGVKDAKIDWKQSWLTITVNNDDWQSLIRQLQQDYENLMAKLRESDGWLESEAFDAPIATAIHTAYHLGAIRQMTRIAGE